MKSLKTLLEKFDETLKIYNIGNYNKLKKPLSENEIDMYLEKLNVDDENFKNLYSWKNGFDFKNGEDRHSQIFDFGGMLSLNYIIELCNDGIDFWEKKYIPIIGNGDGDYILYNNEKGNKHGTLNLYSVSLLFIEDPISYYDSIFSLIATTIKAYETNALKFNEKDNWLDVDINKFYTIASNSNPESQYWKLP